MLEWIHVGSEVMKWPGQQNIIFWSMTLSHCTNCSICSIVRCRNSGGIDFASQRLTVRVKKMIINFASVSRLKDYLCFHLWTFAMLERWQSNVCLSINIKQQKFCACKVWVYLLKTRWYKIHHRRSHIQKFIYLRLSLIVLFFKNNSFLTRDTFQSKK